VAPDPKQIPVISDIERIKKVIEIIEFVGGKVGDIIDNLPTPQSLVEDSPTEAMTENEKRNAEDTNVNTNYGE
jgi:hypothetical protein